MGGQMKGLTQFIADIRNAKAQEDEDKRIQAELVNIQRQFLDHQHLSGYQRKKYVCKLLFIYLLGHTDLQFGFLESTELLSSSVFSEKQVGYLLMQFFVGSDPKLLLTVVNSLKNDLNSSNPDHISLALQSIGTLGDHSILQVLAEDVFKIVRSPTLEPMLKKQLSLALLKLVQLSPSIVLDDHPGWIPRIIACMDDDHIGLAQSVASLVLFIARLAPHECLLCLPSLVQRLELLVVHEQCPQDYYYYNIAAPWFTIKLLTLAETLISADLGPDSQGSISAISLRLLQQIVATVVHRSMSPTATYPSQQLKNTQSAILFACISLGAHLDSAAETSLDIVHLLGKLLTSTETNTRYLLLDALVKVCSNDGSLVHETYGHLSKIMLALKDRDISVRRKALDLVYSICDANTVEDICAELLAHLATSDYTMKGEIAVKVAVLAEKYASEASWYIVTSLNLISQAGNQIGDEVWERTIQIIVNNEKIQPLAVKNVVRKLKTNTFPESIVKVAAFVIGEYGHSVDSSISGLQQFDLLISKYYYCTFLTRAMLLSCFLKMYLRYDDLRPQILDLFESETVSVDSEIQQRAMEYLKLVTGDRGLAFAREVVQQLPPFLENSSPLILRLGNGKHSVVAGSKVTSLTTKKPGSAKPPPPLPRRTRTITANSASALATSALATSSRSLTPQQTSDSSSRLSSLHPQYSTDDFGAANSTPEELPDTLDEPKRLLQLLSANWQEGYYRLVHFDQGIFFESSMLKIIYRCKKSKNSLNFQLTYANQSPLAISGFHVNIVSLSGADSPYVINTVQVPDTHIAVGSRTVHSFDCITRSVFDNSRVPLLQISFMSGTFTQLCLRLPILLIKSVTPAPISNAEDFFRRWQQISLLGADGESQKIFSVSHRYNGASVSRLIYRLGFSLVENVDTNSSNVVGAGILHTLSGNYGCLLRLEPDDEGRQFRVTMRCTGLGVAKILTDTVVELFEHGF